MKLPHINITFTEEEYNLITQAAEKAGMRRTEFCRYARLGKDIKTVPPAEVLRILRELASVRTAIDKMPINHDFDASEKEQCKKLVNKLLDIHYSICALYLTED